MFISDQFVISMFYGQGRGHVIMALLVQANKSLLFETKHVYIAIVNVQPHGICLHSLRLQGLF